MAQRPFFDSNGPLQGKAPPGNRRGFPFGEAIALKSIFRVLHFPINPLAANAAAGVICPLRH